MNRFPDGAARRLLSGILAQYRAHAAVAVAFGLVSLGCSALLMFASGYLICRTAQPATTLFMVMVPIAFVQLFGLGRPIAHYFERLVSHDWVFRVTSNLRLSLFESVEARAGDPVAARASGEYLELLADDIGHLQNLYLRVAFPMVTALVLYLAACVFCGFFSLSLGLSLLALGVLAALLLPVAAACIAQPLQRRAKSARSREFAQLADDIMGATDWALAGRGADAARIHERQGAGYLQADALARRAQRAAELASALVLGAGACAIVAVAGASFCGEAASDQAGLVAAFALGFFPLADMLLLLPGALIDSNVHGDAVARLGKLLERPGSSCGDAPAAEGDASSGASGQPQRAEDTGPAIAIEGASYRYPGGGAPVLDDLNLQVKSGQKLAILGRSGSGKTTLASLVRGTLSPDGGTVLVGGAPARGANAGRIGYIPQEPYVFDMSLRGNLAIANPAADDAQITSALRQVGLSDKLASLPEGLDTHVGETGAGFSGGEEHRLALARALLADFPIVLLDEPFTALDPITEKQLLDTLFEAFDGKTLVVITHHLASIERFDRVVFIEEGRITLDGSPHDLACGEPSFRRLLEFDRGAR